MKKLWRKFKHWLIKKLGGHTMPIIHPQIEYRYAYPERLCVRKDVDFDFLQKDLVYADAIVKRVLAEEIAKTLIERNLLEITSEDDLVYFKRRYEARIMVYCEKGGE